MSFSYTFDHETSILTIYPDNLDSVEQVIALGYEIADLTLPKTYAILCDFRERKHPLSSKDIRRIGQFTSVHETLGRHPMAIVTSNKRVKIAASLFCMIGKAWGLKAAVFSDILHATKWLLTKI